MFDNIIIFEVIKFGLNLEMLQLCTHTNKCRIKELQPPNERNSSIFLERNLYLYSPCLNVDGSLVRRP